MRIGTSDLPYSNSVLLFTIEELLIMGLFIVIIRAVQQKVLAKAS